MATKKKTAPAKAAEVSDSTITSPETAWDRPFADEGDRVAIELNASTAGDVNWKQGYTNRYSLSISEGGKYIERTTFNQIVYMITSKILWFKRAIEQAGQALTQNLTWKVGPNGDFTSLASALEKACEYHPSVTSAGKGSDFKISILLQAGYILDEPITLKNTNLSFVEIGMDEGVNEIQLDYSTDTQVGRVGFFELDNSFLNFGKIKISVINTDKAYSVDSIFNIKNNSFLSAETLEISLNQVLSSALNVINSKMSVKTLTIRELSSRALYFNSSKIDIEDLILKGELSNLDGESIYANNSVINTSIETSGALQIFKLINSKLTLTYIQCDKILNLIDAEASTINILNSNRSAPQITQIVDFAQINSHITGEMIPIFSLKNSVFYCKFFQIMEVNFLLYAFNSNVSFEQLNFAYSEILNADKFKEISGVVNVINSIFNISKSLIFQTNQDNTMRFKYDKDCAYGVFNFKGSQINIGIIQIQQLSVSQIKTIAEYGGKIIEVDNQRYGVFMLNACSANVSFFYINNLNIDMIKRTFNSPIQTNYTDTTLPKPPYYYINAFALDLNAFSSLTLNATQNTITLNNSVASGETENHLWTANLQPFTYGKGGVFAHTPPQVDDKKEEPEKPKVKRYIAGYRRDSFGNTYPVLLPSGSTIGKDYIDVNGQRRVVDGNTPYIWE